MFGKTKKKFTDLEINKRAMAAFEYLTSKCNFRRTLDNNLISIFTTADELLGTYLVVGADIKDKIVKMPESELPSGDQGKIAVILFNEAEPGKTFIFNADEARSGKPHKLYKNSSKKKTVGIKIRKHKSKSFKDHRFGISLGEYIKNIY